MMETSASRSPHLQRVERLNELWRVAGPGPTGSSLPHRLLFSVRRMIAAALRPQETFNAAVVEYINDIATERQRMDDLVELVAQCRAAVDDTLRHREALAARERRIEAGMSALRTTHDELRLSVGVLQQATQTLKHELARARHASGETTPAPATPAPPPAALQGPAQDVLGHKYVGFEDQFRGTPEAIGERLAEYVPVFADATNVLDIGCGRGEFLALLREHGISARGIDTNAAMVQVCRDQGLRADAGDAVSFLRAQPGLSLGGLFAAQVVEHLEPSYLAALLDAAFDTLRPGAPIVLETINPACWFAFFESYIRDITHVRPLHPDTLKYLLLSTGFQRLEIRYRAPYPEHEKLQPIPPNPTLADWVDTLNGNVNKINSLLFTCLDYAAIGYRP
ncbi:MAG TPA: class I SAM-dependent methyltransferase [Vicinamibacterales bacterium]